MVRRPTTALALALLGSLAALTTVTWVAWGVASGTRQPRSLQPAPHELELEAAMRADAMRQLHAAVAAGRLDLDLYAFQPEEGLEQGPAMQGLGDIPPALLREAANPAWRVPSHIGRAYESIHMALEPIGGSSGSRRRLRSNPGTGSEGLGGRWAGVGGPGDFDEGVGYNTTLNASQVRTDARTLATTAVLIGYR
jgi:hypothetical protein